MATARGDPRARRRRGDLPRGHAHRPGPLGAPRRGVGRLALQTGAPVVPIAVIGTEDVRRGVIFRPRPVTRRAAARRCASRASPIRRRSSPARSRTASGRCVELQWVGSAGSLACWPRRPGEDACRGVRRGMKVASRSWLRRPARRRSSTRSSRSCTGRHLRDVYSLRLLPGGQPPRRRGPDGADVPAGLPPFRTCAGASPTAGRCGRGSSASRTTSQRTYYRDRSRTPQTPIDDDVASVGRPHDRGPRGGPRRACADPRRASRNCRTTAARR